MDRDLLHNILQTSYAIN